MLLNKALQEFSEMARKKLGKRLMLLILYGSVARGTSRKDSDIDIFAVVVDRKARDELFKIASKYLEKGILFSIIALTPDEFKKLKDYPFTKSVLREGEILYGKVK